MSQAVDVNVATNVAKRFAAEGPLKDSYLLDGLGAGMARIVSQAGELVIAETGFALSAPAQARVLTRRQWAAENVSSMLELMNPLLERMHERVVAKGSSPLAKMAFGPMVGAQLGVVLGFLSQRVIGQYDLLAGEGNEIWFVGSNVVMTERRFGFVPADFRLWVSLHEVTHLAQFDGNPWLRGYFLDSVKKLVDSLDLDAGKKVLSKIMASRRGEAAGPIALLDPSQRQHFDRLQALMSVIEGHANFVMDRAGAGRIPTQKRMRAVLQSPSASEGIVTKVISRLLGLELKRAQYRQGQQFFDQVLAEGGPGAVAACFESPQSLPSLQEVQNPSLWLARLKAA